ncbi:cation:proton antiporter family protein [Candidatus Methylomicrobium oryzae]|uniref:cation:proton antiporter family protein n=1 Tax=Candidatus Methylomicrobium oryzae TaxID=2802053 RepID=UPI001924C15A|nr:cation:proton antiporter family protein [Methylomicrobium sp. RS1]MBL1262801.1 cation:proton antiporter [Methylomicrobium sp. RS1]
MMELVWVGTAYLVGLLASRLSFPPLVGYLAAGYILHAFGIESESSLTHLADIGIELLLFTVGLKLKLRSLLRQEVLSVGGWHLFLVTGAAGIVFLLQGEQTAGGLVLGASLAFSSTVLAIKVLEDNGELSTLHGRDVLSILILQDIVAIALLAYADGRQPSYWAFALLLLPMLRPLAHRLLTFSEADELKLLLGVSLALAGGLSAQNVGVSPDIGALLMGVMLSAHPQIEELSDKLWSLKEVFLVAFFLQIGLAELPNRDQVFDALGLLGLLPLQGILFFALFLLAGLRARTAFISSLALMTYSEFALITTGAMVKADLLTPEWNSTVALAVAGSLAVAAPLNRYSHELFSRFEPFLVRFEKRAWHPDRLPESIGVAEWLIVGMGRTGLSAYQTLYRLEKRVVGLDADPTVLESLLAEGRRVIYGDAEDSELWSGLPLDRVKGIILTLPEFDARCSAIRQLRKRGYRGLIGTIWYFPEEQQQLELLGADFMIHPLVEAGNQLALQLMQNPAGPRE